MSRYIATYDITANDQRLRASRVLERFGVRLQRSVFEVWLDTDELAELRRLVGPLLAVDDEFEIIPIDAATNRSRWRWGDEGERFDSVNVLGR